MGKAKAVARGVLVTCLFAPVLFVLWVVASAPDKVPGVGIERVGYFQDDERFRVMAYRADAPLTRAQAEAALKNIMHTDGAETIAVIYEPGVTDPGHVLTTARDRFEAAALLARSPMNNWSWYLTIEANGHRSLGAR